MSKGLQKVVFAIGLPLILVLLWWVSTSTGTKSPYFPTPAAFVETFKQLWFSTPALREHALPSVARLTVGVLLVLIIGIILGVVIGMHPALRRLLEPILEFFRAMPPVVMVPVFVLLLGINNTMQVVVIVFGCIWPVLLNTIEGVRSVNAVLLETAQSYQLKGMQRIRYVIFPHALPQIVTGIRVTVPLALILMVVSEMFASFSGLGYLIFKFQRTFAIPQMWAAVVLLGLMGVFANLGLRLVERRLLYWYHGQKEAEHAE